MCLRVWVRVCLPACLYACFYPCLPKELWWGAVHGIEDLIGAVGHQPVSKTVAQAAHEVKNAGDRTAHTAGSLSSAVLGKHLTDSSSGRADLLHQPC